MPKPNHPAKPTSQQVPGVEPLNATADDWTCACGWIDSLIREGKGGKMLPRVLKAMDGLHMGSHVVISAPELNKLQQHMGMEAPSERMMREINALRAREERLRGLRNFALNRRDACEMADCVLQMRVHDDYAQQLESILNEGKT